MIRPLTILFLFFQFVNEISGRQGFGNTEQDWGYITVRPNAHMFWWLYYTTDDVKNYTERPLLMWLQGGPGMPSSGYGNFVELGPLTPSLEIREDSPVKNFNILFVDNPVGTGYSYFSNNSTKVVENSDEIGRDLYHFLKGFLEQKKEFVNVPLYIFGESYGGKMATDLVYHIIKSNKTIGNLKGLGLGAAYISPIDYTLHFAPLAYHLGLIDKRDFTILDETSKRVQDLVNKNKLEEAVDLDASICSEIYSKTTGKIDLYNFLAKTNGSKWLSLYDSSIVLNNLMNNEVKKILEIPQDIEWIFESSEVTDALNADSMNSVAYKIEYILDKSNVKVIVYNGILDFLVNTAGTISWLEKLKWKGASSWLDAPKISLEIDMVYEGYLKKAENLVFYALLRSGHSAPLDNLPAMNEILRREILDEL